MRNSIKMYLYREVKSKLIWFIAFLSILGGIFFPSLLDEGEKVIVFDCIIKNTTSVSCIVIVLMLGTFLPKRFYSNGYIKCLTGYIQDIKTEILSAVISGGIILLLSYITMICITFTSIFITCNDYIIGYDIKKIYAILTQFILDMAFMIFIMFIGEIIKKESFTLLTGFMYVFLLNELVYWGLNATLGKVLKFNIEKLTIYGNLFEIDGKSMINNYVRGVVVAIIYSVLFFFIIINKRKRSDFV